ncbi:hypothetical protein [Runella sp.]|uniref:hypothetical protein n=1 Tax=Runella sp. TaxID=1960881 RepID=UPI003D0D20E6
MKKKFGCLSVLLGLIVLSVVGYGISHFVGGFLDRYQRPWAFSSDSNAPLLVGKWQGNFTDPDGVAKSIHLEIFVPQTTAERWTKSGRRKRGLYRTRRNFDGAATVTSKLGTEHYSIWGSVDRNDDYLFNLHFGAINEKYTILPNFYINIINQGRWRENQMTLPVSFSYRIPGGSAYTNTADPRFDQKPTVTLLRQKE